MVKIGLVLEGGSLRGIFTAGVLDCLLENHVDFSYVVGVSSGACNAFAYLSEQIGRTKRCMMQEETEDKYYGLSQLWRSKKLLNLDRVFFEYPIKQYPFDFDAMFNSPCEYEFVATDCGKGEAVYLTERSDADRLERIGKASCSMPILAAPAELDGTLYMDGGIADPVPYRRAKERGCEKYVVVLTKSASYMPSVSVNMRTLYAVAYRHYPALREQLYRHPQIYERQMTGLIAEEAAGRAFVIRPTGETLGLLESNREKLNDVYESGYDMMQKRLGELQAFMDER